MTLSDLMDRIEAERNAVLPDAADLVEFRNYAAGRQKVELAPGEVKALQNALSHDFCDNLCAKAIETLTAPLNIARWDVSPSRDGGEADAAAVQAFVDRTALLNNLSVLAGRAHQAKLCDRDHYVALKWYQPNPRQPGRVLLQQEDAWDGTTGAWVVYDDDDRVRYGAKDWRTAAGLRRVVWWPDRIERYIKTDTADEWAVYDRPDLGLPWQSAWVDAQGEPLNPPLVHFANTTSFTGGGGGKSDSRYGRSELDGGVLGIQDAVNSIHIDILGSARHAGFPMLGLIGFQPMVDEQGNEVPFAVEPGSVVRTTDPNARIERIQPGSIAELERALLIELKAFSRMTGVPVHNFTGQWPSGTALILSMMDFFDKLRSIINGLTSEWGSVMHKATRLANTFGRAGLDEDAPIAPRFDEVIRFDPLTQAQIADAVSKHVSRREVLRMLNKTEAEQDRILTEMDEDDAASVEGQRALAETARTRALTQAEQASMAEGMTGIAARIQAAAGGA